MCNKWDSRAVLSKLGKNCTGLLQLAVKKEIEARLPCGFQLDKVRQDEKMEASIKNIFSFLLKGYKFLNGVYSMLAFFERPVVLPSWETLI